jgi:hypothetical protein
MYVGCVSKKRCAVVSGKSRGQDCGSLSEAHVGSAPALPMDELGRQIGAQRLLVDGSFVTAKEEPHDIDAVILLPQNFTQQLAQEYAPALELEAMLLTRRPEEIFAAEDETDWEEWVDFFCQTREPDRRRKGLVEIRL